MGTFAVTGGKKLHGELTPQGAKNEALQAVYKAKADVENANAQALVKVATARADAEAMLVTARAESEAVRLRTQVITPFTIQQAWIDKWDGALPVYSTGSNTSMLMQIPK